MSTQYTQLTAEERDIIAILRVQGTKPIKIAMILEHHKSTFCRKLKRSEAPRPQGAASKIILTASEISLAKDDTLYNIIPNHFSRQFIPDRPDKISIFPKLFTPISFYTSGSPSKIIRALIRFNIPTTVEILYLGGKDKNT